jgi:hypothetical protein
MFAYEIQPGNTVNGKIVQHVSDTYDIDPIAPKIHVHYVDGTHEVYALEATV